MQTQSRQSPLRRKRRGQPSAALSAAYGFCLMLMMPLLLLKWESGAAAQGLTSPVGTNSAPILRGPNMPPPTQLPMLNGSHGARVHLGPTGKPCLTVLGDAKPQTINPRIFTHMVIASNDCSMPIKIQVCYYESHECVQLDISGYGRKEVVLGIMPAMNSFRFEYREKFDLGMGGLGAGLN